MLTLDILICSLNTRIVRVPDILMPVKEGVNYIISLQYTKDDYLKMIPEVLLERKDVKLVKLPGEGLSINRNNALLYASSDLVYVIDDDTHLLPQTVDVIQETFEKNPDVDIAVFKTQSYAGKDVHEYEQKERDLTTFRDIHFVLTTEVVCRRSSIAGILSFDPRFGLGSPFLACYEEQIWLADAHRHGMKIRYFPKAINQTSAIFLPRLIYVDNNVQRSFGAMLYYVFGQAAFYKAFKFAFISFRKRTAHFFSLYHHLLQGIFYMRKAGGRRQP